MKKAKSLLTAGALVLSLVLGSVAFRIKRSMDETGILLVT